jgi:hypothetical protein
MLRQYLYFDMAKKGCCCSSAAGSAGGSDPQEALLPAQACAGMLRQYSYFDTSKASTGRAAGSAAGSDPQEALLPGQACAGMLRQYSYFDTSKARNLGVPAAGTASRRCECTACLLYWGKASEASKVGTCCREGELSEPAPAAGKESCE